MKLPDTNWRAIWCKMRHPSINQTIWVVSSEFRLLFYLNSVCEYNFWLLRSTCQKYLYLSSFDLYSQCDIQRWINLISPIKRYNAPFEIGILHYASDTPFTKGKTLAEHLSYYGVDPTYACSVAILRQILEREVSALSQRGCESPDPRRTGNLTTPSAATIRDQEPA